ncbi:MAG: hypothetical protein EHM60_07900 [Lysobacterales bacterium]|jgi:hypothetical protein|nr:MAG: hypothetical protein EHM60_07900 [Xanthomonadales bacterium]
MASTAINVVLCDLPGIVTNRDEIKGALARLFSQVIEKHKLDVSIAVTFTEEAPVARGKDLVCYFVRHYTDSIVAGGFIRDARPDKDDGGLTLFKSDKTVASEVYHQKVQKSDDAARLVLHELMHNMSLVGQQMHQPGMAIGATKVMQGASLSPADMKWIATHLARTTRTQWLGGHSMYGDPLRGAL